eukprot:1456753-Prymnesium_polylepis.2
MRVSTRARVSSTPRIRFCAVDIVSQQRAHRGIPPLLHIRPAARAARTEPLVEAFVRAVCESIDALGAAARRDPALLPMARAFSERAGRSFGRTALCLSGGGGLCNYHWGCVKGLLEEGMLPLIICGTSAGAVVAAAVCTHTDDELRFLLDGERLAAMLTSFEEDVRVVAGRMWAAGHMYDATKWAPKIQALCNAAAVADMTFEEAFCRTGRELCVTVSARRRHEPPLLLNRLASPDVTVWCELGARRAPNQIRSLPSTARMLAVMAAALSMADDARVPSHPVAAAAVLASVAMPFLIPAQQLVRKAPDGSLQPWGEQGRWRDGSIADDTPRLRLAQHFGVSYCAAGRGACCPYVHSTPLRSTADARRFIM